MTTELKHPKWRQLCAIVASEYPDSVSDSDLAERAKRRLIALGFDSYQRPEQISKAIRAVTHSQPEPVAREPKKRTKPNSDIVPFSKAEAADLWRRLEKLITRRV